jgi:Cu(I)/Ag(I) efflux system membrane fusion protein
VSVPRSAVLSTGERNLVFLRSGDGQFVPRLVTLGRTTHDRVEIVSGLSVGDTVVASATFLMDA